MDARPRSSFRLQTVDLLRGLLMILMALDHTRDFFSALTPDPTDPRHSWPALFATRWITHLCAPGFIALAGTSVYLQRQRGKTAGEAGRLLLTRGLWLILLEPTLLTFGWFFTFSPVLQVIWAVGVGMVALAGLQFLPTRTVLGIGAAITVLHNLLDPIRAERLGALRDGWLLLHGFGTLTLHDHVVGLVAYPVIPWVGVICLGYGFGPLVLAEPVRRQRVLLVLAAVFLGVFSLLRVFRGYGDPIRFEVLATPAQTAMSFFDVSKYPPSLEYLLATFGVLLLLYAIADFAVMKDWVPRLRSFFETYGRVPFFYYVLHIYLLHLLALGWTLRLGGDWHFWQKPFAVFRDHLQNWGYSLPVVYVLWLAVVLALYLPSRWFGRVKARRRDWWLSYL